MKKFLVLFLTLFTFSALADDLVIYSGRGEALVAPLFAQFEKDTGIKLDVRYNTTSSLATQLLSEKQNSPADIVFFQESGYLTLLAEAGLLKTLNADLLKQVAPNAQDANGRWLGSSARVRVLAYNTDKVKAEDLPKDLKELADPKWSGKKIGWAPTNASMQSHVSALRKLWGEEATFKWLEGVKNNDPISYPKNAPLVSAVGTGEVLVGWANHYYLHILKKQNPNLAVANYHFPESGKAGNILIISGVAIYEHTQKSPQAQQFIEYLISEKGQKFFTDSYEYPTRIGFAANPDVTPLSEIPFADVSQKDLADVEPTLKMLRTLKLL
jgi:iron(III) transport system substrate-binding protein